MPSVLKPLVTLSLLLHLSSAIAPKSIPPSTLKTSATTIKSSGKSSSSTATIPASLTNQPSATATPWKPIAGLSWQIELSNTVTDFSNPAAVFDIDLFDTPNSTITTLKAAGKKVICYFSAGSYENWRPDAASFTATDKGSAMDGWPGEWWLNTNSANVRAIMARRILLAQTKGCDAIDPDNMDAYDNNNGLNLQESDAVSFATFLAAQANALGLACGLKNAGDIIPQVVNLLDFAVNEQCSQYGECDIYEPFVAAKKPIFHIEYQAAYCNQSLADFSSLLKKMSLNQWFQAC